MSRSVFFTIVAKNYMAYADTLMESVLRHHPSSRRIIVLCDEPAEDLDSPFAEILPARQIGIPDFDNMTFHYDVMELATAVKPSIFLWLFAGDPDAHVIYLDPDILVTAPLVHVLRSLEGDAALVLTPHITAPLQDGHLPDDLTIMKSGIYNLGFAAVRATESSLALLRWWRDRCERDAIVDIVENKFTDQRWMDLAPAFVPGTHILHHHCYNLAYWNLVQRKVSVSRGRTMVDGEPLRFVHFSGINPADRSQFSKHQNRYHTAQIGDLRPLYDAYVERVLAHGWEQSRRAPYAYGAFRSGRTVHSLMRRSFRRHRDTSNDDPWCADGWAFDQGEPDLASLGSPSISRIMYELWVSRIDLQRRFDVHSNDGRADFLKWFGNGANAADAGIDQASVAAVVQVVPSAPSRGRRLRPWPSQRKMLFDGPRHRADNWLAQPVPLNVIIDSDAIRIPRQLALLWESRDDVSRHFPCQTTIELEQFLIWCVTDGIIEQCVDLAIVGPTLAPYLNTAGYEASEASPPLTRLMRLMSSRYQGPFTYLMRDGQSSTLARTALALWLVGPATRDFSWPTSFTASLRDWLARRAMAFAESGLPFSNTVHGLWLLRADVRETFDISNVEGQLKLLAWVLKDGMQEMRLPWEVLGLEIHELLNATIDPATPSFRRCHALLCMAHPELQHRLVAGGPTECNDLVRHLAAQTDHAWSPGTLLAHLAQPLPTVTSHTTPQKPRPTKPLDRILLTGLVTTASGRGEDVRMTDASLRAVGVTPTYLDRNSGQFFRGSEALEPGSLPPFLVNLVHLNAETALSDHLVMRRAGVRDICTIGYWAWELADFPTDWLHAFSIYDEIWTSTRFAHDAIARHSNRPVTLMPMAVELPAIDPGLSRADFGLPLDRTIFYCGFDFRSYVQRKNPESVIAAFRMAFPTGDENVTLMIKTLGGRNNPENLAALCRLAAAADDRIIVQDKEYSAMARSTLVDLCDCYISLHRSEGFGRGPAEAMLLGKPVIATNYSGNTDFMNRRNSLPVDYRLVPVGAGDYPAWEHQEWADPDPAHAARHMRWVVEEPRAARRLGEAAAMYMRRHHSPAVIGPQMLDRLKTVLRSLGKPHPVVPTSIGVARAGLVNRWAASPALAANTGGSKRGGSPAIVHRMANGAAKDASANRHHTNSRQRRPS